MSEIRTKDDPMIESELIERLKIIANRHANVDHPTAASLRLLLREYEQRRSIFKLSVSSIRKAFGV